MRILETRVMRGPNQWSSDEKFLIVLKVALDEITEKQSKSVTDLALSMFPRVSGRLQQPSSSHTAIVQVIRELCSELQCQAGLGCSYARSKKTIADNEYHIIYAYEIEQAGIYAGEAAVEITDALIQDLPVDINKYMETLARLKKRYSIGPTSTYILDEVKKRNIPFRQFDHGSLMTLGYGSKQKKIRTAVTDATSALGMEMAGDKEETKKLLLEANMPVPKGILVYSEEELIDRIHEVQYPLVIKPLDGNHGRGVTTDINDTEKALFGYSIASKISSAVIVEEFVKGDDYRFLVINFKLIAAALRMPAYVTGDGKSTIQQLIDEENKNPQRGDSSDHVLALIKVDEVTKKILSHHNHTLDTILPKGERLILKDTANISAGGTATDVTDQVHPENRFMVERIAKMFNLDICGIDIMATSVSVPITRDIGAIIEVNAGPGLRMHSNPQQGPKRNVAAPILDMLFHTPAAARIPVVAITGTNGKTTTTRLIAHIAKEAGHRPGFCTSDGIYIDGHLTYEGDCTGMVSAQQVLFDPTIDFAVLECARGGIIRSGLGFDECDISIVTNITEDHLGMKDIHSLDDLARVKAVVPRSTKKTGYAILNADDNKVYGMYEGLNCNIALFSLDPDSERIHEHVKNNGMAAIVENGNITVIHGYKIVVESVEKIPLTFGGKAEFMVKNILAAVLAGVISGFDTAVIRHALQSFIPSADLTPGRMNLFDFGEFRVMVDYVHNIDGFSEIKKFLSKIPGSKTGVISVAGDRRDSDITGVGMLAATIFDRVIVRHDRNSRGREKNEVPELILKGVREVNKDLPAEIIPDELDAIDEAVEKAAKGSFIFICADKVKDTLRYVKSLSEQAHAHVHK